MERKASAKSIEKITSREHECHAGMELNCATVIHQERLVASMLCVSNKLMCQSGLEGKPIAKRE
jgi:hypothetical protein